MEVGVEDGDPSDKENNYNKATIITWRFGVEDWSTNNEIQRCPAAQGSNEELLDYFKK